MSSIRGLAIVAIVAVLVIASFLILYNNHANQQGSIQAAATLQIQFTTPPTPADGATVEASYVTIAASSSTSAAEHSAFLDWDSSLVAWWRFDDAADLTDHSTYSNDGTDHGSTFASSGKRGGAREFDGTAEGSYIEVSDHTSLNPTNKMTVAAWVNLDESKTYHAVITKDQPDISYWFGTNFEKPVLYVSAVGGSSFETCLADNAISTGAWHHIAFTYNGNAVQFYTDGSPNGGACSQFSGPIYSSTSDVWIGESDRWGENNDNALAGKIDELMVFNRALSDEEILSLYDASEPNQYNSQISGLINGTYTYRAHAIDSDGDTVQTEQRTVTIEVTTVCGNNIKEAGEACDGTDLGDSTCANIGQGFTGGILACMAGCDGFDINGCTSGVGPPTANIKVEPSTTVEAGEEVFFDATGTTDDKSLIEGRFEWQFGDGYTLMYGYPLSSTMDSGIVASHFYMQPGTYTVTLTVTDTDGNLDTATKTMTVITPPYGPPKTDNIELLHADFHGHIAQYIYTQIAEAATQTAKIKVMIKGDNDYDQVIHQGPASAGQEIKFLLNNSEPPAGTYYLVVQLLDSADELVDQVSEKFSKPYDGIPHVGIDENNAICIDGVPFFPVTPWIVTKGYGMSHYAAAKIINTLTAEGWYSGGHNLETWKDYLNEGASHDLYVIGPSGYWMYGTARKYWRNHDINDLANYVTETKNHPAMLIWMYADEPQLGGRGGNTPPPVIRSWTYKSHQLDPQHLVTLESYGYSYLSNENTMNMWDYLYNADQFGGKKQHIADIYGFDVYPLEFKQTFENWAWVMDRIRERNYNLVPLLAAIEVQDDGTMELNHGIFTPGPTAEQLRMEYWISVTHGTKAILQFPLFKPRPAENDGAMAGFVRQITALSPVVLGPESEREVVDNANAWGNRVDTIVREDDENIWIFAVRVTEANYDKTYTHGEVYELHPDEIGDRTVTFTVDGLISGTLVYEPAEFMASVYENHGTPAGGRTFSFTTNEPITPGTLLVAGKVSEYYFGWRFLYDDGVGGLYGLDTATTGTVNYETGEVYADFGTSNNIYAGEEYVRGMYQPVRDDRIVAVTTGNTFTDTFAPNEVRIYRIPKEVIPDTEPPTTPQNLQATIQSHSLIYLSWTPSTDDVGIAGYRIYRNGTEIATSPTNSYNDQSVQPSITYSYQASAYDASGKESGLSNPVSATTPEAPSACTDGETKPCGTSDGICAPGTMPCIAGNWSSDCIGGVSPCEGTWDNPVSPCIEDCTNNLDDDCNGVVNDGCEPGGEDITILWIILGIISVAVMIAILIWQIKPFGR